MIDYKLMIVLPPNPSIASYQIVRVPDGFVINILYTADIQNQNVNIVIDPSKTGIKQLSRLSSITLNTVIKPDNNASAYYYDPTVYKLASVIGLFATAISIAALVVYFIAILGYKMVGIQMMAVLQISFLSLMLISDVNPCFQALANLWLVNGYNRINASHYLQDQLTPIPPKGIYLYSRYLQNYNFTLILIIIPFIVSLIGWLLKGRTNK